ncbi:acyltransferase family protein [Pseudodonghicola flavimaris]|uniref:Acyltransferase n=1 Tax=Pseudodonghicola flavimaris TaxID=3050036 RepID=A0ABT7F855_9RHOB|nr:acyltransferase [Pseudodonghicola flavimaris]MDK3020791.1 acyltransferase [Pseudodonghicola flavimaris]
MRWLADAPRIADRSGGRDNNFDLIRMLAATGVMVSHAYPLALGAGTPEPLETFLKGDNLGRACVFAFFSISGFYIARSFLGKRDVSAFLRARILRLYPALFGMLLVTGLVAALALSQAPGIWAALPGYVLRGLTFSGSGLPGMFPDNPLPGTVNGSLWTLPYEVLFYLTVLVVGVLGLFDRKPLVVLVALLFLASYYAGPMLTGRYYVLSALYLGLPFLVGVCFYLWQDRIPLSPVIAGGLVLLVLLLRPTPLFLPVFILALAYGLFWLGFARTPRLQVYNRLGDYSYGTYIYAFPVQQTVAEAGVGMGGMTPLGHLAIAVPVTFALAALSWHLIEAPALRLRRPAFWRTGA